MAKHLDRKELLTLKKDIKSKIQDIKKQIKEEEKINEFSRKVDHLYDSLEGTELLLDAVEMAVSEMDGLRRKAGNETQESLVKEFEDAVDFADRNGAEYSKRYVLDRVVVPDRNESVNKRTSGIIASRMIKTRMSERLKTDRNLPLLERRSVVEKRNVRKKTLDDYNFMVGASQDPAYPYSSIVSNGRYYYATGDDFLDLIEQTGIDPRYTRNLPKDHTRILRLTSTNRSESVPLNSLNMEVQGNQIIVIDQEGHKLKGDSDDFSKLKSWFAATPRRIRAFFVPYDDETVFLCLESQGEFGTMMLSYR